MTGVTARTLERIYRKKKQIKQIEQEVEDLYESMGELDPDNYVAGDYIFKLSANRKFDPTTAKKVLTPAEYKKVLKSVPNAALARAVLDEDTFAMTQKVVGVRREVVRVEDEDD